MTLTEQQVEGVLQESLHRQMWELDVDGNPPRDFKDREVAANELIRQAQLAYRAGNRSEGVTTLLYVAEDDLVSAEPNQPHQQHQNRDTGGTQMATAEVDLSEHPLEALHKFEETLLSPGYDQNNPDVRESLSAVRAEIVSKGGTPKGASPPPQVSELVDASQNGADRKALEDRLTFSAMRSHGIDPSEIPGLSDAQLQWIVDHPGGDGQAAATAPPAEQPASIETTRMVVNREPEASPSPEVAQKSGISSEREELEGQVTGPVLKAYGRGRTDVPEIGDSELRFMIENPDGRVTQEQLLAARAADEGTETKSDPEPEMVVTKEVLGPEQADSFLPPQEAPITAADVAEIDERREAATLADKNQRITKAQALSRELPTNPAQEIIDQEHFPIAPEIDEKPPRLPFDLSKCADEEVRSYHARFHACHSRANYVVGLWEGELRDILKLRKGREVEVANTAPTKDPDDSRKRLTDAQREAWVAADSEVVALKEREHEIERVLRQLRTLRDGYASDVSTSSRQWSMRHAEAEGAGGLR